MKNISSRIANFLGNQKIIDKNEVDICRYGLEVFASSTIMLLCILLISIFAGNFLETIFFFMAFIPLRIYAGGYHANTKFRCFLTSLVVYFLFTFLLYIIPQGIYTTVCLGEIFFTLAVILLFSPVIHINKNVNKKEILHYRKISINICMLEIMVVSVLILILKNHTIVLSFALGQLAEALAILTAIIKRTWIGN